MHRIERVDAVTHKQFGIQFLAVLLGTVVVMVPAPVTEAQCLTEVQKLLAADGEADDSFGGAGRGSIGIVGDTILVPSWKDDDLGLDSGSIYVFRLDRSTARWKQQDKFSASDGAPGDNFGEALAVEGRALIVGAPFADAAGTDSGAAYLLCNEPPGSSSWVEVAKLQPADGSAGDEFSRSQVGISSGAVIVGSHFDDDNGNNSGSAYIFRNDPPGSDDWIEEAKLLASDGAPGDEFGLAVAISENVAVVGSFRDDDRGTESGSVYVYRHVGEVWMEEAKLLASDGAAGDFFGYSVAMTESTVIVGAWRHDASRGAAYVYRNVPLGSSIWVEEAKLVASDRTAGDIFGDVVELRGDLALIGAHHDDDGGFESGSAYVFRFDAALATWNEACKLVPRDNEPGDLFGSSLGTNGHWIAVGARRDDDNGFRAGSAYVYACDEAPVFRRGDCNRDGIYSFRDVRRLVRYLLFPFPIPCQDACDANDDGRVNFYDAIVSIHFLVHRGLSAFPSPFPECGADPTDDALDCESYDSCP